MKYITKKAEDLKVNDIISWDSGYFDLIEDIDYDKLGDIRIRSNSDTTTMSFKPTEKLRIVKND